ncbi:TRAP transporter substrate-binding protein [Roseomonas sp. AR75]|uniref:TRAP transporter substrate-binding protein n=1 Tax=Roseomonas sp. AR75 TaxID=2562311 RepID=UPI00148528E9|nr:TRAP transporter substrate-binding protein DctP [Roseomonas sp. AR75]
MPLTRRALLASALAASGTLALPRLALAQAVRWNVGFVNATGSSYVESLKPAPQRIAQATGGKLTIELYDTLVAGPEQPAAVRDGRLDGSFAVTPWLSAEAPYMNFGHLPGLLTDVAQYQRMLDPLLREEMARVWREKYRSVQLATGVFEDQCIISRAPLRTVGDFSGKKVRVHNTEAGALMQKIGAAPTPVPFGEIVPALQRGIVDLVMTSVGTAGGFGFHNVAQNFSTWRIGTVVPWSLVINQQVWQRLPDDVKPAVQAEFRKIEDEHFANHRPFSDAAIARLVTSGMQHYVAPPEQLAILFAPANVDAVFDNWYQRVQRSGYDGRALVQRIEALKARG